jgi:peptide/nickel transport system permease protein
MLAYTMRRVSASVPILVIATFVVFIMVSLSGDPLSVAMRKREGG